MENRGGPGSSPGLARLAFLDGLRGLTALYVVLYHCYFTEVTVHDLHDNYSLGQRLAIHWLGFGEEAMAVFVVLSGYCLMRSVLQAGAKIQGGVGGFLLHRAKRLLIPYYIVLVVLLALIKTIPTMNAINVELFAKWPQQSNVSAGNLASHFLLFPNLKEAWKFSIDPPCWGVATFWWLYVLFALVLLPLWRRIGSVATAVLALAVTLVPHFFLHGKDSAASPWFVGIFTIGMAAAATGARNEGRLGSRLSIMPRGAWLVMAAVLFVACAYIGMMHEQWMWEHIFAMDILVGCAAACFVIYCAERVKAGGLPFPLSVLEWRSLVALGRLSYSLFLVHFPTLWLLHAYVVTPMQAGPFEKFAVLAAAGVPSCWAVAAIFYVGVERHFMGERR